MGSTLLSRLGLLVFVARGLMAATVTYDFNITWVRANPDGLQDRPVIGINGQWPIPTIEADVGDRVVVNVVNGLGNQSTSLHFHGLFMSGQTHMDGPAQVSQCAIPPGSRFTYNFTISQPGTYWYHSHTTAQYPDGLRAPLIVHDPDSPFRGAYASEVVLTVSDWYHDQMADLIPSFISKFNPTGAEPVPNAALWNDSQNLTVPVRPGTTYLFRLANVGAFAGQYVWFEGHNVSVVEVDGVYTRPAAASMLYLSPGQRCSFLLTTRNDTAANFPFVASMDTTLFDTIPDGLNWNVTGWLVYDTANENRAAELVDNFNPLDDMTLVPYDNQTLLGQPDRTITLDLQMMNLEDGASYSFFNNITYVSPKVPTLYTLLSAGSQAADPTIYGDYTNSFVLQRDEVVDVVVNNLDTGRHPLHLHGHAFQALYRSSDGAGTFQAAANVTATADIPMRRDTIVVEPLGFLVFRFQASNPGVWFFHCHIEWHMATGLVATFVEAPLDVQQQGLALAIPADHFAACRAAGIPTAGNAAGNAGQGHWLDLAGQNAPPGWLPAGFTTNGALALAFSCLCGVVGIIAIGWYGIADVGVGNGNISGGRTGSGAEGASTTTNAATATVEEVGTRVGLRLGLGLGIR